MENPNQKLDYFGLTTNGISDKDAYALGNNNVILLTPEAAYQKYGQGQNQDEFNQKYEEVKNKYLNFKQAAYFNDVYDFTKTPAWSTEGRPGYTVEGGNFTKQLTDEQIATGGDVISHGQVTGLKPKDVTPGQLVLEYNDKNVPYWRMREEGESIAGKNVNSIFGPSEMYSSAMNKAWSGLWNGSIATLPSAAAGVYKIAGDLGEAIYNAGSGKGFTASGTAPWDKAYNESLAFSKSIKNINDDQQDNMWYDFNQGLASLLTAAAFGYAGGVAGEAAGLATEATAAMSRGASLGIGSMQVMDSFIEQSKAAGIPDAEIALMAPIIGSITAWSESKFGPDWVFDQYEKAGAKKIFQKEFLGSLKEYAEANGIASMEQMPKSAYAKAINNLTGKMGSIWSGVSSGEGPVYDFLKGSLGEAAEEFSEQIFQNALTKGYDYFKVNYSSLTDDQKVALQKNKGLYFDKDFSLGQIYNDVTSGAGYSAVLGGLTGGVANLGISLVNKAKQTNTQKDLILEAIINGNVDELKAAITDAYEKDPHFPAANWTDGQQPVMYDENGQKVNKSMKDIVYEQKMRDIDLMNEIYQKSGIANPEFIKNSVMGDKSLAYSALQAVTEIKLGENKIQQLEEAKKLAQQQGTWTEPASPEQDEIAQTQKAIDLYKQQYQYVASGKAYSDKLKTNLIGAYGAKNINLIATLPDGKMFVDANDVDTFNAKLKENKAKTIQEIQDRIKNQQSILSGQSARVGELEQSAIDNDFVDKLDSLLGDINNYGSDPEAAKRLASHLSERIAQTQNDVDELISQGLLDEVVTTGNALEALKERKTLLDESLKKKVTNKFDENEFLLNQYFPAREAINRLSVEDEEQSKIVLSNPNLLIPGGFLDFSQAELNKSKQIAAVNADLYPTLDKKHTGLEEAEHLTAEQKQMIMDEANDLDQKLNQIREKTQTAVNDRKLEQTKMNVATVRLRNHVLDYAIKMTKVNDDDRAKKAIAALNGAIDELNKEEGNHEEALLKAEKNMTLLESLLHDEFKKEPKLRVKIAEAIMLAQRTGNNANLSDTSLMSPIEFLGRDFKDIYSVKSLEGLDANSVSAFHNSFAVYFMNSYLNDIQRMDSNQFAKTLADIFESDVMEGTNVPSYEQIQAIKQVAGFMMNPSNTWVKEYQEMRLKHSKYLKKEEIDTKFANMIMNSLFVRGFAGGGKTTTIIPLGMEVFKRMANLENMRIIHVAPTQPLLDKLIQSTTTIRKNTTPKSYTTKEFVELTDNVTDAYDVVLIDEASLLSFNHIDKIRQLQAKGTKFIFIGDQSQVSDVLLEGKMLPIEGVTERTTPVTVSYRNSSVDINYLLSRYRKAIFINEQVELPNVVHNASETFGAKYYNSVESIIDSFVKDSNNNVDSWIVVSDKNKRNGIIEKLIKKGINSNKAEAAVRTILFDEYSAQGLENSKVYVAISPSDVSQSGIADLQLYNRMMLTGISRAGSKMTNIGFVGVLDETGAGKSKVGNPIESMGIQVDKQATINKVKNMYNDGLKPEVKEQPKQEPKKSTAETITQPVTPGQPVQAATDSTEPTPTSSKTKTGKPQITTDQLDKLYTRIDRGEKGLVDKALKHFELTDKQLATLLSYEKQHEEQFGNRVGEARQKLIDLGFPIEEINNYGYDDLFGFADKGLKYEQIAPRPGKKAEEVDEQLPILGAQYFIKSAENFAVTQTIPVNTFAVQAESNISQENLDENPGQRAKIDYLTGWFGSDAPKKVVIKYHPTLQLHNGKTAYLEKNVFGLWSDETPNAVFLGTLFSANAELGDKIVPVDNISYTDSSAVASVIKKIETGFVNEKDPIKRKKLIDYHKAIVELKQKVAKEVNGLAVSVGQLKPIQFVKSKGDNQMPTLAQFMQRAQAYGKDRIRFTAPYQITRNGKTYLAMKASFLGDAEKGVEVKMVMDKLKRQDIDDILYKDGKIDGDVMVGLKDAAKVFKLSEMYPSRAMNTLMFNRTILSDMIKAKNGVERFLAISPDGLKVNPIGETATDVFENTIKFYEFLGKNPNIYQQLYLMPSLMGQKMNEEAAWQLADLDSIKNRIYVDVNFETPIKFPSLTIGVKTSTIENKLTQKEVDEELQRDNEGFSIDDFLMEHAKISTTVKAQRINSLKAKEIIRRLLGDTVDVELKSELYNSNGKALFGLAMRGYIALEDKGGVEKTTPKHEVLHIIMNSLLKSKYRNELLNAARQVIADTQNRDINSITDNDAEEFMARQYGEIDGMPPHPLLAPIYRFLKWLRNLFRTANSNQDFLNDFYSDIEYGKFYGETETNPGVFEKANEQYDSNLEDTEMGYELFEERQTDPTRKELDQKYGDLYDYNSLGKMFGTVEQADLLKPMYKQQIVKFMFPLTIMANGKFIRPRTLNETINEVQQYFERQANARVTQEMIDKWEKDGINGTNMMTLPKSERANYMLYQIKNNQSITHKYFQSIFKSTDIAKLLETGDLNYAMRKRGTDILAKKENQFFDIADNRSDILELLLDSIPAKRFAFVNGVLTQMPLDNRYPIVNPNLIKTALIKAGKGIGTLNNFNKLYNNLVDIAKSMAINPNGDVTTNELTDTGNAIYSFLAHFGHLDPAFAQIDKPETWSFYYIAKNKKAIEDYYGCNKNMLWKMHHLNAVEVINSLTTAFASNRSVNPIQYRVTSYYDVQEKRFKTRGESLNLRPTQVDNIKNNIKDNINRVLFAEIDNDIAVNPDFAEKLNEKYEFERTADSFKVKSYGRVLIDGKAIPGGYNFTLNPELTLSEVNQMFRIMGIDLGAKALNIFWTNRAPETDIMARKHEYPFDKTRLTQILGTMMLSAKTLSDPNYLNDINLTARLNTMMTKSGSMSQDEETSRQYEVPSPADFYRMVEQLAEARSAAIGEQGEFKYFTPDNKRAYAVVPTDATHDLIGHGDSEMNKDGADKVIAEYERIRLSAVTIEDKLNVVRFNPNFYLQDGELRYMNPVLDKDPSGHIHLGKMRDNNGGKSDFKGAAYGKSATLRDTVNFHLTPFIESALNPKAQQILPIAGPTRSDSTQGEIIEYIIPAIKKFVSKNGITKEGRAWMNNQVRRIFDMHQREVETSIERWRNFFENVLPAGKKIMLTEEQYNSFKENPYALREYVKNVITDMGDIIVHGNSGLYENKDFVIKNGKVDFGFATLFNSYFKVEDGQEVIKYRDDIYNWKNYQNMNALADNAAEQDKLIADIFRTPYFRMTRFLKNDAKYRIPDTLKDAGLGKYGVKNDKGEWTLNPVYEAYFMMQNIVMNTVYPLTLGHINQYKTIEDFYKRDKDGPGLTPQIDDVIGMPETYRNVVIEDEAGITHTQLEQMGLVAPGTLINPSDGLQLIAPTTAHKLYKAYGGKMGVLGKGQWKFSYRGVNPATGVFDFDKSSTLHLSGQMLELGSTFGMNVQGGNNYFEDMLKRMYSERLYNQLNMFRQTMSFDDAVAALADLIDSKPELRNEVNDFITYKSARKSSVNMVNRLTSNFDQLVPTTQFYKNLRHQLNSDQEADDAEATGPKQGFAFMGIMGHNKQYVEELNVAQIAKAQEILNNAKAQINRAQGDNDRERFHNYLKSMGIKASTAMKDYGIIAQALASDDVSLEPSLLRNKTVQLFLKEMSKAMRFKARGMRVINLPGLFSVYDGNDGNVYTLKAIKKLSLTDQEKLGLVTKNDDGSYQLVEGRMLHADRMENGQMLPGEVVGTYIHGAEFGLKAGESVIDGMTIRYNDGSSVRIDKLSDSELTDLVEKGLKKGKINIEQTPMLRSGEDILQWANDFRKSVYGMSWRVPTGGLNSGMYRIMIDSIDDYASHQFSNPLKNLLDGKDYDADQSSDFSFSRTRPADNSILQAQINVFTDPNNHSVINTPVDISEERNYVSDLKDKLNLRYGQYQTDLHMYKANNDGKRIIDRFAIAGKLYAFAWQASQVNPDLFNGFNFNSEAQTNFNEFVNTLTNKWLNLSVDNSKEQVLGFIGANPESVNAIMGIIMSNDKIFPDMPGMTKFKEIAEFLKKPHVKQVFEVAQASGSLDDTKKRVFKVIQNKIIALNALIENQSAMNPAEIAASQLRVLSDEEVTTSVILDYTSLEDDVADVKADILASIEENRQKIEDLHLLEKFDLMGEALLRLNTLFRLDAKGIPTKDYDRHTFLRGKYGIDFVLGMPIDEFFKDGGEEFTRNNPNWIMETKRSSLPETSDNKWKVLKDEEARRENRIRAMVDYAGVLQSLPLHKEYLSIAVEADDKVKKNFIVGGELWQSAYDTQLANLRKDDWDTDEQFYLFTREFERLILSVYLNQLDTEFKPMTSGLSAYQETYNLKTVHGRERYKRDFMNWLIRYKEQNPELVAANKFLNNVVVSTLGMRSYIEVPFKDSMSPSTIVDLQADAQKLQDRDTYKFDNRASKDSDGNPIADISLYDAFVLYQLMEEDFSGGKKSMMDLLGVNAFTKISRFYENQLLPSIKSNTPLELFADDGSAMLKTFKDTLNAPWMRDMLMRAKQLLPYFNTDAFNEALKDGDASTYFKRNVKGRNGRMQEAMFETTPEGIIQLMSNTSNRNLYSVDQPTVESAYKEVDGELIKKQNIPSLSAGQMEKLEMGQTIDIAFPDSRDYHIGLVTLPEGVLGQVVSVQNQGKNIVVKRLNNVISPSINSVDDVIEEFLNDPKKTSSTAMKFLNGRTYNVTSTTKAELLVQIAQKSNNPIARGLANLMITNPKIAFRINRDGLVHYVDPAMIDAKTRMAIETARVNENDSSLVVGGGFNTINRDVYINPVCADNAKIIMHEFVHNLTTDVFDNYDPNDEAHVRYRSRMEQIFDTVKAEAIARADVRFYGLTNPSEMISEAFVNPEFQKFLASVPSILREKSLWDEIVEAVRDLLVNLGIPSELLGDNALNDILSETIVLSQATVKDQDILESEPWKVYRARNMNVSEQEAMEYFKRCLK